MRKREKKIIRLNSLCVYDLIDFTEKLGLQMSEQLASALCTNQASTIVYGLYEESTLLAVLSASLFLSLPNEQVKEGKFIYISALQTLPDLSNDTKEMCIKALMQAINIDAIQLGAERIIVAEYLAKSLELLQEGS